MRTQLLWMAIGAALSTSAFLAARFVSFDHTTELKPYLLLSDKYGFADDPKDRVETSDVLPAKRSARIAYECGTKTLTVRPSHGPDDPDSIIVPAGIEDERATSCIQLRAKDGGIEFRYLWLSAKDLIFG